MANHPFDREIINVRERPFSSDINLAETYADVSLRETMRSLFSQRLSISDSSATLPSTARFLGTAFQVVPSSPVSRRIALVPGIGIVGGNSQEFNINSILGLNDVSFLKPLVLSQPQFFDVPASAQFRVDIIEVRSNYFLTDSQSRDVFDPATGSFSPQDKPKTFSWTLNGQVGYTTINNDSTMPISYKQGINDESTVPEVTPGYTKIAEIYVGSASSGIAENDIVDLRAIASPYGQTIVSGVLKLSRNVLVNNSPHLPEIVSLIAPPGVSVGCSFVQAGPDPAVDLGFDSYEIVVKGLYEAAHANVSLVGYNRKFLEVNYVGTDNQFYTISYDTVLTSLETLEQAGNTRANRLDDPASTETPLLIRPEQPVVVLNFTFRQLLEKHCVPGGLFPPVGCTINTEYIVNPIFVNFTLYLSR